MSIINSVKDIRSNLAFFLIIILFIKNSVSPSYIVYMKAKKTGNIRIMNDEQIRGRNGYIPACPTTICVGNSCSYTQSCYATVDDVNSIISAEWYDNNCFNFNECCEEMFKGLIDIEEIDMSFFDLSNFKQTRLMFALSGFISINLTNSNTQNLMNMQETFKDCKSLVSVTLNIDAFNVINMEYMFAYCSSLKSVNFNGLISSDKSTLSHTFESCESLISLDLTSFIFKGQTTEYMFYNCRSLKSIIFPTNTDQFFSNMNGMFKGCKSLISLDISSFHSAKDFSEVFTNCKNLTEIIFSENFIIKGKYMNSTFSGCESLAFLNLSSFDTSNVESMYKLFYDCKSLSSIELSNSFNLTKVKTLEKMFYGCESLVYLDTSLFDTPLVTKANEMFYNCNSLKYLNLSKFDMSHLKNINRMFYGTQSLEYINLKSSINLTNLTDFIDVVYGIADFNVICYDKSVLYFIADELKKKCSVTICDEDWEEEKTRIFKEKESCFEICGEATFYKYKYKESCLSSCPPNTIQENYICKDLVTDEEIEEEGINTNKNSNTMKLLTDIGVNFSDNIRDSNNNYNINCNINDYLYNSCKIIFKSNKDKELLVQNIKKAILDNSLDTLLLDIINGYKNIVIYEEKEIYQITTLSKQKYYSNLSIIDLNLCERILRDHYNMKNEEEIIIFTVEHIIKDFKIPIIEYELFTENGNINLDLGLCNKTFIYYNLPVTINENELYKYDPNSDYYNKLCNQYTTDFSTDITIYDRRNDYKENKLSLCEANCTYKGYNSTTRSALCECPPNNVINFFGYVEIDQDKLIHQFKCFKQITNIEVLKCYKLLFTKD